MTAAEILRCRRLTAGTLTPRTLGRRLPHQPAVDNCPTISSDSRVPLCERPQQTSTPPPRQAAGRKYVAASMSLLRAGFQFWPSKHERVLSEMGNAATRCAAKILSHPCLLWVKTRIPPFWAYVSFFRQLRTLGCQCFRRLECAPDGGQLQAAFLTGCWAWRSSYCAGVR